MRIVTDSATDTGLLHDKDTDANITIVPLRVNIGEKNFQDGDIEPDEFYIELEKSDVLPVTSQPSAGEFAKVYRAIAKKDPDILSIHISSGLSGTVNSALAAVKMVPEANITIVDTKTLSAAAGWQVWAAVKGLKLGWPKEKILKKLKDQSFYGGRDIHWDFERGTLNGVYRFLEELGVRWFFPGRFGTVIPKKQNIELKSMKIRESNILIYTLCTILDIMEHEEVWHKVKMVKKLDKTEIGKNAEESIRTLLDILRIDFDHLEEKYSTEYHRQNILYKNHESDGR